MGEGPEIFDDFGNALERDAYFALSVTLCPVADTVSLRKAG